MPSPFDVRSAEEFAQLRETLRQAGYDEKGLIGVLGPIQLPARAGKDLPHFLYLTRGSTPLHTLIRLFVIGAPAEPGAAREAARPAALEDWERMGLVETRGGAVYGRTRILPFRSLLLACDYVDALEPGGQFEQVMGITASSAALADFAVRRPCRAALDLGTGSGVQAFAAAEHSDAVTGVDKAARSIAFARFNAGLNAVPKCEFLEGDCFEPVRGRTFDLVVSNPPFAITPSSRYLYRDSGVALDGFCRALVREAPAYLNEGGLFQICCDWAHIQGQNWQERLSGWFKGSGCDVWVLRTDHHLAHDYAHIWIRDTEHEEPDAVNRLYESWIDYYNSHGVSEISTGLIAMRRAPGRTNWIRIEDAPSDMTGAIGEYVALGFEMHDYLDTMRSDERLLDQKLKVAPLVRLDQRCEPGEGAWRTASAEIRLARGITYSSPIDLRLAGLVGRSNGQRTLRDLMAEMAAATNSDLAKITPNCLLLVRQLIERGFLLPA